MPTLESATFLEGNGITANHAVSLSPSRGFLSVSCDSFQEKSIPLGIRIRRAAFPSRNIFRSKMQHFLTAFVS
jgi:hypothetical protein